MKSFFLLEGQLSWAPHWKERGTDPPGSRGIEEGCSGAIQERKGCLGPCAGPSPLPVLTSVSPSVHQHKHPPPRRAVQVREAISRGMGRLVPRRAMTTGTGVSSAGTASAWNPRELAQARDESGSFTGPRQPLAQLISGLPTWFPFDSAPGAPQGRCECWSEGEIREMGQRHCSHQPGKPVPVPAPPRTRGLRCGSQEGTQALGREVSWSPKQEDGRGGSLVPCRECVGALKV